MTSFLSLERRKPIDTKIDIPLLNQPRSPPHIRRLAEWDLQLKDKVSLDAISNRIETIEKIVSSTYRSAQEIVDLRSHLVLIAAPLTAMPHTLEEIKNLNNKILEETTETYSRAMFLFGFLSNLTISIAILLLILFQASLVKSQDIDKNLKIHVSIGTTSRYLNDIFVNIKSVIALKTININEFNEQFMKFDNEIAEIKKALNIIKDNNSLCNFQKWVGESDHETNPYRGQYDSDNHLTDMCAIMVQQILDEIENEIKPYYEAKLQLQIFLITKFAANGISLFSKDINQTRNGRALPLIFAGIKILTPILRFAAKTILPNIISSIKHRVLKNGVDNTVSTLTDRSHKGTYVALGVTSLSFLSSVLLRQQFKNLRNRSVLHEQFGDKYSQQQRNPIQFMHLYIEIKHIQNTLRSNIRINIAKLVAITNALAMIEQGQLSPVLFTNLDMSKLRLEIQDYRQKTGLDSQLIGEDSTDLQNVYAYSTCFLIAHNNSLLLTIHIPATSSKDIFELFKISSVPFISKESIPMELKDPPKFYANSKDGTSYIAMSQEDYDSCMVAWDQKFLCNVQRPVNSERNLCYRSINLEGHVNNRSFNSCTFVKAASDKHRFLPVGINTWLFYLPREAIMSTFCPQDDRDGQEQLQLSRSGLMSYGVRCSAEIDHFRFSDSSYEIVSKAEVPNEQLISLIEMAKNLFKAFSNQAPNFLTLINETEIKKFNDKEDLPTLFTRLRSTFQSSEIQQIRKESDEAKTDMHYLFNFLIGVAITAAGFISSLIIIFIRYKCPEKRTYRHHRRLRNNNVQGNNGTDPILLSSHPKSVNETTSSAMSDSTYLEIGPLKPPIIRQQFRNAKRTQFPSERGSSSHFQSVDNQQCQQRTLVPWQRFNEEDNSSQSDNFRDIEVSLPNNFPVTPYPPPRNFRPQIAPKPLLQFGGFRTDISEPSIDGYIGTSSPFSPIGIAVDDLIQPQRCHFENPARIYPFQEMQNLARIQFDIPGILNQSQNDRNLAITAQPKEVAPTPMQNSRALAKAAGRPTFPPRYDVKLY